MMVRALDPAVVSFLWQAIYHHLPEPVDNHPLRCHRKRVPDLLCFRGILIRLTTGSSWEDVEALMEYKVSDTTLRARRDEWISAGVFAELEAETRAGYDRIIGLDLGFVAIDGSIHKAPCGGEGTGKSPVDRAKLGHKWSVAADANGIPIGVAIDGANRNDLKLLEPTIDSIMINGLLDDIELLALDRGYDYPVVRTRLAAYGLTELEIQKNSQVAAAIVWGGSPKPMSSSTTLRRAVRAAGTPAHEWRGRSPHRILVTERVSSVDGFVAACATETFPALVGGA